MAAVQLGSKAEGSIIKLKENGVLVDFYVAKQNYESGLNGAGRVLVVRKDGIPSPQWNSSGVNAYANSTLDVHLNGSYKNQLDANIRTAMSTTKFCQHRCDFVVFRRTGNVEKWRVNVYSP